MTTISPQPIGADGRTWESPRAKMDDDEVDLSRISYEERIAPKHPKRNKRAQSGGAQSPTTLSRYRLSR